MTDAVTEETSETTPAAPKPTVRHEMPDPHPTLGRLTPMSALLAIAMTAAVAELAGGLVLGGSEPFLVAAGIATAVLVVHALVFGRGRGARATRKLLVRLPVLRNHEVQRIGALAGCAATTCARCESFSAEEGQRWLAGTVFGRMGAPHLTPAQMAKTHNRPWSKESGFDADGRPIDEGTGPSWNELGMCSKKRIGTFAPHTCKEWS